MTVYIYPAMVAVNPNLPGSVVVNGTGQVYALTDTSYTTPLSITDLNGVHLVNLASNGFGLVQPFKVDGYQQVIFYANGTPVLLTAPLTPADLTTTVYNETTTPGAATQTALNATYVQTLGKSNGTDDSSWINAAIAGGGKFRGLAGQTYKANIVIPSNTTLDMGGCTVTLPVGATGGNLITNVARTAVASATDAAISSGSTTVTTAVAASVGKTVVITGAGGNGNGPLVATVTAAGSGTLTLSVAASATVSAAAISVYNRDKNIRVIGGDWQRGSVAGTGTGLHNLVFRHVDGLLVDIDSFSSTGGKYGINTGDCTDQQLGIGSVASNSDGIHINGPARGVRILRISGTTGDDSVAFTGADYSAYNDVCGDITDVHVAAFRTTSTTANLLKFLAGAGCTIDRARADGVYGSPAIHGVWIGDDAGQAATIGGAYGDIDVSISAILQNPASNFPLRLISPNANRIRAKICGSNTSGYAAGTSGSSTATINRLELDLDYTSTAGAFFANSSTTTIKSMIVDGFVQLTSGTSQMVRSELGSIVDLEMRGRFESLTSHSGNAVRSVSAATQTIANLKLSGVFSGFDNAYRGSPNAVGAAVTVSGRFTGCNRITGFYNGANTVVLANPTIDSMGLEAFYVSGASVFVQGSIGMLLNAYSGGLFGRAAAESIRVNGPSIPFDFAKSTPSDQDEANNTNAGMACGLGKAMYSTSAAKWKNIYTGVQSLTATT